MKNRSYAVASAIFYRSFSYLLPLDFYREIYWALSFHLILNKIAVLCRPLEYFYFLSNLSPSETQQFSALFSRIQRDFLLLLEELQSGGKFTSHL